MTGLIDALGLLMVLANVASSLPGSSSTRCYRVEYAAQFVSAACQVHTSGLVVASENVGSFLSCTARRAAHRYRFCELLMSMSCC